MRRNYVRTRKPSSSSYSLDENYIFLPENPPLPINSPRSDWQYIRLPLPERWIDGDNRAGELRLHVRIDSARCLHGKDVGDDVV